MSLTEAVDDEINSLGSSSHTISDNEYILASYKNISALHNNLRGFRLIRICIHHTAFECSAASVYRIHYQRLTHTNLVCHTADKGLVSDCHCSIAGEIEIIQRIKGVIFITEIGSQCIYPRRKSLDQDACEFGGIHCHQSVNIWNDILCDTYPVYQIRTRLPLIQDLDKQFTDFIYRSQF